MVADQIATLISTAQALLLVLNNLEDRLDVIHGIVAREHASVAGDRDDVLAQLWTLLGGNRAQLGGLERQLSLLREVGDYRQTAVGYVTAAVLRLQGMETGLDDLRERMAVPGSVAVGVGETDDGIVKLEVLVDHVQRGVERLEAVREKKRKVEAEVIRKAVDAGVDAGRMGKSDGEWGLWERAEIEA
jgi:hypothetical protein